jgi:hypothetical protein
MMMTVTGMAMISKMTMRLGYDDERDNEMTMFAGTWLLLLSIDGWYSLI